MDGWLCLARPRAVEGRLLYIAPLETVGDKRKPAKPNLDGGTGAADPPAQAILHDAKRLLVMLGSARHRPA